MDLKRRNHWPWWQWWQWICWMFCLGFWTKRMNEWLSGKWEFEGMKESLALILVGWRDFDHSNLVHYWPKKLDIPPQKWYAIKERMGQIVPSMEEMPTFLAFVHPCVHFTLSFVCPSNIFLRILFSIGLCRGLRIWKVETIFPFFLFLRPTFVPSLHLATISLFAIQPRGRLLKG